MKSLKDLMIDSLNESAVIEACENGECSDKETSKKTIKDEKDFRDYAENKFKKVFGDKLDEDKMKSIIDSIAKDYSDDWGKAVGILNKSFGK